MSASTLYDRDFYAWANSQATLLRSGNLAQADIEHIAEEIESMGRTEKRELVNRLTVLLMHLLKWEFQPLRRSASWQITIRGQRRAILDHMKDNPSLKSQIPEAIGRAYLNAIDDAVLETSLPENTFPAVCPWSFEQMMNEGFWSET
jgi:hypothetical protein